MENICELSGVNHFSDRKKNKSKFKFQVKERTDKYWQKNMKKDDTEKFNFT